jgi:hypothetical protein
MEVRRADERGRTKIDWLDSRHTFSFGGYHDPRHMGYSVLRVINDDIVAPERGFGTHPHRDMEILTWVLSGALSHRDSMGTGSTIRPGEIQRMSAGTGVMHSEWNESATEPVRLLQIWILPDREGREPGYEQTGFPTEELSGKLRLVASPDGREGSVTIHQDAALRIARLAEGEAVDHAPAGNRHQWLQVARGGVVLNDVALDEGDGAAFEGPARIAGRESAEILLFDLP